ncbi:hypothetical protein C4569_02850 [Candidatus Parcubacteria bacterium]|nr:MAG: hypothetical protein C4569_02850 [Candidatus Parcubacteria bacterium]
MENKIIFRLNKIKGQISGISKLCEKNSRCLNIIQQIEAVKGALNSLEALILQDQFRTQKSDRTTEENLRQSIKYLIGKR